MFRIILAPKATPNKGEIELLSQTFVKFNDFEIDTEAKTLTVYYSPNTDHGYYDADYCTKLISEFWSLNKELDYEFFGNYGVMFKIPDTHKVIVILK